MCKILSVGAIPTKSQMVNNTEHNNNNVNWKLREVKGTDKG